MIEGTFELRRGVRIRRASPSVDRCEKKWLFLSVPKHRNPLESDKFCREYIRLEKEAITE